MIQENMNFSQAKTKSCLLKSKLTANKSSEDFQAKTALTIPLNLQIILNFLYGKKSKLIRIWANKKDKE